MSAMDFVASLLDAGRVRVPGPGAALTGVDEAVRELDRAARPEMAYEPPPLAVPAAGWALATIYRACQALVYREIDAEAVRTALSAACPGAVSPSVCYSADLALRYLPDLLSLARGIAEDDPLVTGLTTLARAWPLSSVGVDGIGAADVDTSPFFRDPSLRQLYVDRVIDKGDAGRLGDAAVFEGVRAALGDLPELAPRLRLEMPHADSARTGDPI